VIPKQTLQKKKKKKRNTKKALVMQINLTQARTRSVTKATQVKNKKIHKRKSKIYIYGGGGWGETVNWGAVICGARSGTQKPWAGERGA